MRAVYAWRDPYLPARGFGAAEDFQSDVLCEQGVEALDAISAEVADTESGVQFDGVVADGPAAIVLVDAAEGAELLAVGSRGHGGFVGLPLGSVSQQCVTHAPCPVLVVRGQFSGSAPAASQRDPRGAIQRLSNPSTPASTSKSSS